MVKFTKEEREVFNVLLHDESLRLLQRLSPQYQMYENENNIIDITDLFELRKIRKKRYDLILGMIRKLESCKDTLFLGD